MKVVTLDFYLEILSNGRTFVSINYIREIMGQIMFFLRPHKLNRALYFDEVEGVYI